MEVNADFSAFQARNVLKPVMIGAMRLRPSHLLPLLFALLSPAVLHAQSAAAEIEGRLKGKPLFLRGQWSDNNLKFDAQGHPDKNYAVVPFTYSGIDVRSVELKGNVLKIVGVRAGLEFDKAGAMKRDVLDGHGYSGTIRIEINGGVGADYTSALNAVFAPSLASMVPQMPDFWQKYARAHFLPLDSQTPSVAIAPVVPTTSGKTGSSSMAPEARTLHVGGNVKPPQVIYSVKPTFTNAARLMRLNGSAEIYCWVEEDGTPSHIAVARPLGLGLDEQAVAALTKYRFTPARRNDQPVKVDLYMDVNFQIF